MLGKPKPRMLQVSGGLVRKVRKNVQDAFSVLKVPAYLECSEFLNRDFFDHFQ